MKRQDTTKDESINMTPSLQQKINQNGFTNSPPLTQIMPPIIVILSLIMTLVSINIQLDSKGPMVAFNLLLIVDFAFVLFLWYKATSIVPTCSIQLAHQAAIEKGQQFVGSSLSLFCQICKTYINKNCFHCKRCRRCVQFFDHHCKWLNNCIGAKNYFEFYGLIITTFILLALCIGLNASCLSQIEMEQNTSDVVLACSILTILIACIPCCWLIYLICLHTYLICTKKTTIQLIMESRNKNQIKPKNEKNHVFKVTFTKDEVDHSVAIKKVIFPDKEEELQDSTETNHNLIRHTREDLIKNSKQDKLTLTEPSIQITLSKGKSLPPIKKLNHSFTSSKGNKSLGVTLSPPSIKRY